MISKLSLAALVLAGAVHAVPVEPRQGSCAATASLPSVNIQTLPNPFQFWDGTQVATMDDFKCRQQQLQYALEQTELGDFPGAPDTLRATSSGSSISITVGVGSRTATFSVSVRSAGSGTSPRGAVIAYGYPSVTVPSNVAVITFGNDQFAAQNGQGSRGQGLFYNIFGSSHSAGALTAWAWGVDRIMDALEQLGAGQTGIDPARVAVTGCSRNGKGAFVAGALVKRIALTIPQESGSGGAACWRISDSELAMGKSIQTAGQIVTENVWFSTRFNQWTSRITQDPVDHEALVALVAPRGLYVPENDIGWLGPVSTTGCMRAGQLIYEALGVPEHMGFSLVGGHGHCSFPYSQNSEINQFWDYFINQGSTKPSVISVSSASVNVQQWAPWNIPRITGEY